MSRIMIWDIPIRVFHWAFAVCAGSALALALLTDGGGPLFALHMLFGLAACFILIIRIALGLIGSKYNRLQTMIFSPKETLNYFRGIITGSAPRYIVHNPGTSAAAIGMFVLVPLLAWTGFGLTGEGAKDIHGPMAHVLLALILAHLVGLVIHTLRHRENIALSMITGIKNGPSEQGLQSAHLISGLVVLLISAIWIVSLFANYNAGNRTVTLPATGITLQLGEAD